MSTDSIKPQTPVLPSRITMITLGARDLPRLREFYWDWGWETDEQWDSERYASFELTGVGLSLFPIDLLSQEAAPGAPIPIDQLWNGVTMAINLDDKDQVDLAIARAVEAGATLVNAAVDRDWGGFSGYLADPEGNRWEVAWSPH